MSTRLEEGFSNKKDLLSQISACQKRSHKAAFFDIMGIGDEDAEERN
jgi:hypothetical protein